MLFSKKIIQLLQTSGAARLACVLIVFAAVAAVLAVIRYAEIGTPVIISIEPSIGSPDDILVIRGRNFGEQKIENYIDIAGIKPTLTSYLQWTDTLIMVRLPENTGTGLVYVHCRKKQSNPKLFADRTSIPVAALQADPAKSPYITSLNMKRCLVGDILVISGRNFGTTRDDSKVLFPWICASVGQVQNNEQTIMLSASEADYDYESWSDQEIKVKIPTGSVTGNIQISTKKYTSNPAYIDIDNRISCSESRRYAVTVEAEISDVTADGDNVIYVRIPRPLNTPFQSVAETGTPNPVPLISNHQDKILHRIDNAEQNRVYTFSHSFIIDSYAINNDIKEQTVKPYKNTKTPLYLESTSETDLLPVQKPYIAQLLKKMNIQTKNPYTKAKKIFDYMVQNFEIELTETKDSIERAADRMEGSGCTATLLYTTLLRAAGIPARPCAGFFIDNQRQAQPHWWTELYFENIGWIPADVYIALSHEFKLITEPDSRAEFYFGNNDAQHVIFSRGEIQQKAMAVNSKTVSYPSSYAFQNIWEESAGKISMYTSFWRNLSVTGIY